MLEKEGGVISKQREDVDLGTTKVGGKKERGCMSLGQGKQGKPSCWKEWRSTLVPE